MRTILVDGKKITTNFGTSGADALVVGNDRANRTMIIPLFGESKAQLLARCVRYGYNIITLCETSTRIRGLHENLAYCARTDKYNTEEPEEYFVTEKNENTGRKGIDAGKYVDLVRAEAPAPKTEVKVVEGAEYVVDEEDGITALIESIDEEKDEVIFRCRCWKDGYDSQEACTIEEANEFAEGILLEDSKEYRRYKEYHDEVEAEKQKQEKAKNEPVKVAKSAYIYKGFTVRKYRSKWEVAITDEFGARFRWLCYTKKDAIRFIDDHVADEKAMEDSWIYEGMKFKVDEDKIGNGGICWVEVISIKNAVVEYAWYNDSQNMIHAEYIKTFEEEMLEGIRTGQYRLVDRFTILYTTQNGDVDQIVSITDADSESEAYDRFMNGNVYIKGEMLPAEEWVAEVIDVFDELEGVIG